MAVVLRFVGFISNRLGLLFCPTIGQAPVILLNYHKSRLYRSVCYNSTVSHSTRIVPSPIGTQTLFLVLALPSAVLICEQWRFTPTPPRRCTGDNLPSPPRLIVEVVYFPCLYRTNIDRNFDWSHWHICPKIRLFVDRFWMCCRFLAVPSNYFVSACSDHFYCDKNNLEKCMAPLLHYNEMCW